MTTLLFGSVDMFTESYKRLLSLVIGKGWLFMLEKLILRLGTFIVLPFASLKFTKHNMVLMIYLNEHLEYYLYENVGDKLFLPSVCRAKGYSKSQKFKLFFRHISCAMSEHRTATCGQNMLWMKSSSLQAIFLRQSTYITRKTISTDGQFIAKVLAILQSLEPLWPHDRHQPQHLGVIEITTGQKGCVFH